jgi:hypothetical protein
MRPLRRPAVHERSHLSIIPTTLTPQDVCYWQQCIQGKDYELELERTLAGLPGRTKAALQKSKPVIIRLTASGHQQLIVRLADGGRLIDQGERMVADPCTPDAAVALAAIARLKKWHALQLDGSLAAQHQVSRYLAQVQIEVHGYVGTIEDAAGSDGTAQDFSGASSDRTSSINRSDEGDWRWDDVPTL